MCLRFLQYTAVIPLFHRADNADGGRGQARWSLLERLLVSEVPGFALLHFSCRFPGPDWLLIWFQCKEPLETTLENNAAISFRVMYV